MGHSPSVLFFTRARIYIIHLFRPQDDPDLTPKIRPRGPQIWTPYLDPLFRPLLYRVSRELLYIGYEVVYMGYNR